LQRCIGLGVQRLSIIVPALDEAGCIGASLARLQAARGRGHELIVVDGGSGDGTPEQCDGLVDQLLRAGRGRSLAHTIETLNPLLRGWINYFQLTQSKSVLEELDGWMRRRLRCLLWRQWKRPRTRARQLRALGLDAERAWTSAYNGHGPWWNAGASHLNQVLPAAYFTRLGLVSLLRAQQRLQCVR